MKWSRLLTIFSLLLVAAFMFSSVSAEEAAASSEPSFSLPEEELAKLRENAETFQFQAEVNRMMTLIINSLYKNKEIFLRELISNASDALDKIRFLSLTLADALKSNTDLSIKIQADEKNKILHIADSGIGMTKEDLIKNLGTLAKSGTADFFKKFEEAGGDMNLIGQFGVGFYSVFLVADRVTVTTKHNDDKQYIWESTSDSDFTIIEDPRGNTLGRGTVISLHLKEEASDYLKQETLKDLIKKYSEFINFPIYLWTTKTETIEVPIDSEEKGKEVNVDGTEVKKEVEEEEEEAEEEDEDEEGVEDVEDEEEEDEEEETEEPGDQEGVVKKTKSKPKTKLIEKVSTSFDLINDSKPIWLRSPSDVTEKEYENFFKSFFKGETEAPLAYTHFKAEGEVEFRSILYVPPTAPPSLYSNTPINEIKLFVRRVFITDTESEPLLPSYLRFVKGIVDSDDLPLNVSRETLQQSKLLKVIKKKLTRKALDMFKDLAEKDDEKYQKFYKQFSTSIKLGVIEDSTNRNRLAKLLRFHTSESKETQVSLDKYLERLKKGQDSIYFLAGATIEEVLASPFLERLEARGYEVLLLHDPIDEYTFQSFTEYEGKKFVNAAKEGLKFGDEEEENEDAEEKFKPLTEWMKEVLSEHVEKVSLSNRLTTSPCALVASQWSWSGNMERIMKSQAYAREDDPTTSFYLKQKKNLEINPKHPVILELLKRVEDSNVEEETKEIAKLLFDTATLRSGYSLKSPVDFATRIEKVIRTNLGVDLDAQVEVNEEKAPLAKEAEETKEEGEEGEETKAEEVVTEVPAEEEEHVHDEL